MTWVADTSWLYALIDASDPHHARALTEACEPEPVEVPQIILSETLDLLSYRHGRDVAKKALEGFERLPHFVLGENVPHETVAAVWRAFDALSYADAVAVAVARRAGAELRSFDRAQVRALEGLRAD